MGMPHHPALEDSPMRFLDHIPFSILIVVTVLMLGAPFVPEPHLVEKVRMLFSGTLTRPLDIFDLFWHLLPAGLLALKIWRTRARQGQVR